MRLDADATLYPAGGGGSGSDCCRCRRDEPSLPLLLRAGNSIGIPEEEEGGREGVGVDWPPAVLYSPFPPSSS